MIRSDSGAQDAPHPLYVREYLPGGEDRSINILFGVRRGHKPSLERGRCEIDAFGQHAMEESLESLNVASHCLSITGDGFGGKK